MLNENNFTPLECGVRLSDCSSASRDEVEVTLDWTANKLQWQATNRTNRALNIKEVVLFAGDTPFPAHTPFYGEGFQMLCQYGGTLDQPRVIGAYGTDWGFFRFPRTVFHDNLWSVYNLLLLSPKDENHVLLAFTSCRRFSGEFRFKGSYLEIVMDTENLTLEPGESWELESFMVATSADRNRLFDELADCLNASHPPMSYPDIPTGWCSFYCLRPMTSDGLYDNARAMKETIPELKRIQIDGGYAAADGDFLIPNPALGSDVRTTSERIRECGVEAAGYISPFIVEPGSRLHMDHPDWLVQDEHGNPFNGIGRKTDRPNKQWYILDTSHPEARNYLKSAVKVMHDEWGWRYFKLDFLQYGAFQGHRYDKKATRIEAFRLGIQAIVDEVGHDSFVLGCNAPFWPLLGLVHGNRVTNDIARDWKHVRGNAEEQFHRNWQNGKLWINDPDVIVLERVTFRSRTAGGQIVEKPSIITDDEFEFHKAVILASGGMIVSGDLIPQLSEANVRVLKKLLPPIGHAAQFDDESFTVGTIDSGDRMIKLVFNFGDEPVDVEIGLDGRRHMYEFWTDADLGIHSGKLSVNGLKPHSAQVFYYNVTAE